MHIPDGLMDPVVWLVGWAVAIALIAVAVRRVGDRLDEKTMPLIAVLAAGIFVAQMLNFPVGGGTTGHLIGAALATILVGPWAAMLMMTVILIIQGLVFGDGGVTAMGLNILNMAIIAPAITWLVLQSFGKDKRGFAFPVAAWTSVFFSAMVCAAELVLSYLVSGGAYGLPGIVAIPSMAAYHIVIGIGEAIITSGILFYVSRTAPEMLRIRSEMADRKSERAEG